MGNVFSVQIYFATFCETLEVSMIISVLLSFVNHSLREYHARQNALAETHIDLSQDPGGKSIVTEKFGEAQGSPGHNFMRPPVSPTTKPRSGIYNNNHNKLKRKKIMTTSNYFSNPAIFQRWQLQIWLSSAIGLLLCIIIGLSFFAAFYAREDLHHPRENLWFETELLWRGILSLIASIFISLMGSVMLCVNKEQQIWRRKMSHAMLSAKQQQHEATPSKLVGSLSSVDNSTISVVGSESKESAHSGWRVVIEYLPQWITTYAMALLPLVTVLREGLELMMVISGVAFTVPGRSIPLPALCGIVTGSSIGYAVYRGGNAITIQGFLIAGACLLHLLAAELFSRAVWLLERHTFALRVGNGSVAEAGTGTGSYNIGASAWHVNCCSPRPVSGGGWQLFGAMLGWQNSATHGSVIAYNIYWLVVMLAIAVVWYKKRYSNARQSRPLNQLDQSLLRKRGEIGSLQLPQRQEPPQLQDLELQHQY